jgi:acetolactate synthase-1/2/3 large subunit
MRVADAIVRQLSDLGVRHIFLLPGGGAMHLNDALARNGEIQAIACHHEQACGIAAEAYGRTGFSGNPGFGVAMVTTGPGATNIITAVAGAWIDSVPMLVIAGQVKRSDLTKTSNVRQTGVQEVDALSMVRGITKLALCVESAEAAESVIEDAIRVMFAGRPGPVWIEIPLDVQGAPAVPYRTPRSVCSGSVKEKGLSAGDATTIVDLIGRSTRPLIVAGHGVRLSGATAAFRQLVERWNIPVVMSWNALDLLPFDHRLNVGRPGVVASRAPNFAVQNSDLVLIIGCRLDNVFTAYNLKNFARAATKVVIDIDAGELERLANYADYEFCADAASAIECLLDSHYEYSSDHQAWRDKCSSWKAKYAATLSNSHPDDETISHYDLVKSLSSVIPADTVVATGSSGLSIEVFYSFFENKEGQRLFLTSGLGSMGYGLPAAIGACLGSDSRPLVLIEGDGSLMLNIQELATLAALSLPIRIVVFDNDGYASIRNTQRNYFESRFLATSPSSGLFIPDLVRVAEAFGIKAFGVSRLNDLREALEATISDCRPQLLVVKVRPDEFLEPKVSAIPQPDGTMLSMPLEDMSPLLSLEELSSNMLNGVSEISVRARR